MNIKTILTTTGASFAMLFSACGGAATNAPANKPATNTNAASNSSSTNSAANTSTAPAKTDTASNEELDFTLVNKTGYDIKQVYIGPSSNKDWTDDMEVLKGRAYKDGTPLDIKFHPKTTATRWDIKVEWADGDAPVEWYEMNLTKIEKITLKYDRASGKTTAETE